MVIEEREHFSLGGKEEGDRETLTEGCDVLQNLIFGIYVDTVSIPIQTKDQPIKRSIYRDKRIQRKKTFFPSFSFMHRPGPYFSSTGASETNETKREIYINSRETYLYNYNNAFEELLKISRSDRKLKCGRLSQHLSINEG